MKWQNVIHRRRPLILAAALLAVGGIVVYFVVTPYAQGYYHRRQALRALKDDDLATALVHLRHWAAVRPTDSHAHFLLARTLRRDQQAEACHEELDIAERLGHDPEQIALERVMARAQIGILVDTEDVLVAHLKAGHHDEELILEALVRGLVRGDQITEANRWVSIWIERYPRAWQAYLIRGKLWELKPRLDLALQDYQKSLQLRPNHAEAEYLVAETLRKQDRYDEALPRLVACHERSPEDAKIVGALARCLRAMGRTQVARDLLVQWAEGRNAADAEVYVILSQLERDLERPEAAIQWLLRAQQQTPQEYEVVSGLAHIYRELGKTEEAERYSLQAKDLRAKLTKLDDIVRRIRNSPDDLAGNFEAGRILMELGHKTAAVRYFHEVLRIDPDYRPAHEQLSAHYLDRGDRDLAQKHRLAAEGKLKVTVERRN